MVVIIAAHMGHHSVSRAKPEDPLLLEDPRIKVIANKYKKICTKILDRKMHRPHLLMLEQLPEKQKPEGTLPGS